ncbi:testis-expressed protein 50 [Erinaceus europaeus]|uniref:Testis-expressed protein 50 n=1 Tax=Erinaceus europaeus TaxID=9365 RepID=A0A1S2ZVJ2_ERIEU|nr:testis-expressed protein 50 [Erinaceus europaeus]
MSAKGLSLSFPLLFICFFMESFCICDRSTWTKVGWEIFPDEALHLKFKRPPTSCLPYPVDKIYCILANLDIFGSCLRITYISVEILLLILTVLSVHYLCMKWKKHKRKVKRQETIQTIDNGLEIESFQDIEQILCRLIATVTMLTKYLNKAVHHPSAKKSKYGKIRGKKVKAVRSRKTLDYPYAALSKMNITTGLY